MPQLILPSSPTPHGSPRGMSTWALRPLTGNFVGDTLKISDLGPNIVTVTWNGTAWAHSHPIVLAQGALPVILGPKSTGGISATTGAFTLDTALQATYAQAWMFLPADAVVDGLAGLYYCTFSSSTEGICHTNYHAAATAFTPTVPTGTLVPAVGAAAAWAATATSDLAMLNITVPSGIMGATGKVRLSYLLSTSNSGNAKIVKCAFGALAVLSSSTTTTLSQWITREIANVTAAKQVISPVATLDQGTAAALLRGTVATTADVALTVTGQLHTTDAGAGAIVLESFTVEVLPGA